MRAHRTLPYPERHPLKDAALGAGHVLTGCCQPQLVYGHALVDGRSRSRR